MTDQDEIYVFLVHATAGVGNAKMVGDRYPVMVLVRAGSPEEAEDVALKVLRRNFWELPEVKRVAPLSPKLGTSEYLEKAISDAAVHGASLIVYDKSRSSSGADKAKRQYGGRVIQRTRNG